MAHAIVINIASPGETIVEKNKLSERSERSFRKIQTIEIKNILSNTTHCESNIPVNITSSMQITNSNIVANPINFPKIIDHLLIGFESMRYIVRPSISRAMSPPAKNNITANPESSIKESPKSTITRLFSPSERELSPNDNNIKTMERKIMREKSRLRINSLNVLRAILNIF